VKGVLAVGLWLQITVALGVVSEYFQCQEGLMIAKGSLLGFVWLLIVAGLCACMAVIVAAIRVIVLYAVEGLFVVIDALK